MKKLIIIGLITLVFTGNLFAQKGQLKLGMGLSAYYPDFEKLDVIPDFISPSFEMGYHITDNLLLKK